MGDRCGTCGGPYVRSRNDPHGLGHCVDDACDRGRPARLHARWLRVQRGSPRSRTPVATGHDVGQRGLVQERVRQFEDIYGDRPAAHRTAITGPAGVVAEGRGAAGAGSSASSSAMAEVARDRERLQDAALRGIDMLTEAVAADQATEGELEQLRGNIVSGIAVLWGAVDIRPENPPATEPDPEREPGPSAEPSA